MTSFEAAVAAEVLAAAGARREMLQSIADVARAIYLSAAASIALLDERSGEFRFEAVSGEGEGALVGRRFPAGVGIAGVVAQTGEPAVVDDLTDDPRFARELAKETGYVPDAIMVAPLLRGERTLGVLSVLDRGKTGRTTMQELELLAAFGQQAALALDLGEAARRAEELLRGEGDAAAVARLAGRLEHLDGDRREAAAALLDTLERLLR